MAKVGVFVDSQNIYMCGGKRMRYEYLRKFACRDGAELIRLNAYISHEADTATPATIKFHTSLRLAGYKVILKPVKTFYDSDGQIHKKSNADLDLAVDMMLQSRSLDRVVLVTGDGDFTKVVAAVQNMGCRVELIAFENISRELRHEVDFFISGHMIPGLLPVIDGGQAQWGEPGSRVRGVCYFMQANDGFGFMRFLKGISKNLYASDTRDVDSPYGTAYFKTSWLPSGLSPDDLPSPDYIFEFSYEPSGFEPGKFEAKNIRLAAKL